MRVNKLHILHIANSYGGSEVYTNLILALDHLGVRQTVFVPLNPNNHNRIGNHMVPFSVPGSSIIYSKILKTYHRYFYTAKISKITKEIEKKIDLSRVDLIHAGLFSSDGAVAYELYSQYKIPYIVAVRNTDVNTYYKKLFWKRKYFHTILEKAKNIVFLSPRYKKTFLDNIKNKVNNKTALELVEKSVVIPNGVDPFYLKNRSTKERRINSPIRIIFAGAFNKGKNILEVIYALDILINKGLNINFTIIGNGLKFRKQDSTYTTKIFELALEREWIEVLDYKPKEELRQIFNKSDIFVMPSIPETFGLVYVEALSQGLPIIYAKGQGFDGYYSNIGIGFGVNARDYNDIANKIEQIIDNYDQISSNISKLDLEDDFDWENIAARYFELYKN